MGSTNISKFKKGIRELKWQTAVIILEDEFSCCNENVEKGLYRPPVAYLR